MAETTEILGVPIHNVSEVEAVDLLIHFVYTKRPHQVVTVNPEFIMCARRDPEFLHILRTADLALPDGIGILLAGRLLGRPFKARVTGVDTVRRLAGAAAQHRFNVFLLGARPGIAERAADALRAEHPGLQIVGTYAGSPALAEETEITARIRAAQTDILFVAYGAPAQDKWIRRNLVPSGASLAIGVGGAFDFISGVARRAPKWMQNLGLEWLHRLCHQPWRWRRMAVLPQFITLVLLERLRGSPQRSST